METSTQGVKLRLNWKRTFIIGLAFLGILLLWQVYNMWCPTFLEESFREIAASSRGVDISEVKSEDVAYIVGVVMALDNVGALILMPIFGRLSDKTRTPLGKRMPYILVGTLVCAIAFPFVPVFFHYNNVAGMIAMMVIVILFAMMYRNPAVALMPDFTPKPLRSKANGIINIMGYVGGLVATLVGIIFVLSNYFIPDKGERNIWLIVMPFVIASLVMVISAIVLVFTVRENELAAKVADELEEGERQAAIPDSVEDDDNKPMSKANLIMLILILGAEFFWFMADNSVETFMINYSRNFLYMKTSSNMIMTIAGGVGSVAAFAVGGFIADKIGRKYTLLGGLGLTIVGYILWVAFQFSIKVSLPEAGAFNDAPFYLYIVWVFKGFGMGLVHLNSFPMVVELCSKKKVGQFTGYFYAGSMTAQTITPILLGLILRIETFEWSVLPIYAGICTVIAFVIFCFIKNIKTKKVANAKGLEGIGAEGD